MQERVPRVSVRRSGTVIFPRSAHPLPCTVRSQVVPRLLVLIREGVFVLLYHLYRTPAFHTQHFPKCRRINKRFPEEQKIQEAYRMNPTTELPKTYAPAEFEDRIYQMWCNRGYFTPDPTNPAPAFSVVTFPPRM